MVMYTPKGELWLVCNLSRVRCSEMFKIGKGWLIDEPLESISRADCANTHSERVKPDVVLDGSTTETSSVSIALIVVVACRLR